MTHQTVFTRRLTRNNPSLHPLAYLAILQIDQRQLRPQDIVQSMGYHRKNFIQACDRLRYVLSSDTLGLDGSYLDARFDAEAFLQTLFAVLQVTPDDYQSGIDDIKYRIEQQKSSSSVKKSIINPE